MKKPLIIIKDVRKEFIVEKKPNVVALDGVASISRRTSLLRRHPSGCGKTTLLNIAGWKHLIAEV